MGKKTGIRVHAINAMTYARVLYQRASAPHSFAGIHTYLFSVSQTTASWMLPSLNRRSSAFSPQNSRNAAAVKKARASVRERTRMYTQRQASVRSAPKIIFDLTATHSAAASIQHEGNNRRQQQDHAHTHTHAPKYTPASLSVGRGPLSSMRLAEPALSSRPTVTPAYARGCACEAARFPCAEMGQSYPNKTGESTCIS